MHPFTKQIALPEPIADGSTEPAEVLDQITTVGQTLRLADRLTGRKQVPGTDQVPGMFDLWRGCVAVVLTGNDAG
ncbi:MAG: hypothetical protein SXV54_10985 [Chloroflexota bacterium]|nr:hypothetical protein [Chloroflexota bacterium]